MSGEERPVTLLGTAYGPWETGGKQAVYAVVAVNDDRTMVAVVLAGHRGRGESFTVEPVWRAVGTWRSTLDFQSLLLSPSTTVTSNPWPRRVPKVDLPHLNLEAP